MHTIVCICPALIAHAGSSSHNALALAIQWPCTQALIHITVISLLLPLCTYSVDGKFKRDRDSDEEGSSSKPPQKRLRSMSPKDTSHGNPEIMYVV